MHVTDLSAFPLVVLRWSPPTDDASLAQFFREMSSLLDRAASGRQHYAIVSVGDADFSAVQRKRIAAWLAALSPERAQWDLGSFVVVDSVLSRGALTAMKWLAPGVPALQKIHLFSSLDDARLAALEAIRRGPGSTQARRWSLHG